MTGTAQDDSTAFRWGNGYYYNLNAGESVIFGGLEVKLLEIKNHYNLVKIDEDTLSLKVSRRTAASEYKNIRIFVADNRNVALLNPKSQRLLTKDALICLSDSRKPLLDLDKYIFPVSFNEGFTWQTEEESYPFSFYKEKESGNHSDYYEYEGVGINIHNTGGGKTHRIVAIENSRVAWIETEKDASGGNRSFVLLKSESQPDIYYLYSNLNFKSLEVKRGQSLIRGDVIGTAHENYSWEHFQLSVIKLFFEPSLQECGNYIIGSFPQLFGLYYSQSPAALRSYTRGRIFFGMPRKFNGNQKNNLACEPYTGKGWLLGNWNIADKVEWVSDGVTGNVRLGKVLFKGTEAECENPDNFYEYKLTVPNGTYRIRAKTGDLFMPSWQKLEFEGVSSPVKKLEAGEFEWTGERVVKVKDGSLNIRIYIDENENRVAGISEIVFQQAY